MFKTLRLITALTVTVLAASLIAGESAASGAELIDRGETQLAAGDIDGAIATLGQAVEADRASPLAHTRLGGAYLLGQRYGEAIEQFQQAIALDAQTPAAFIGLGMAYLHGGRNGPARAALLEAKRLDPSKAGDVDRLIRRIDQAGTVDNPHR